MTPAFKYVIAAIIFMASVAATVQGLIALQNHVDLGGYNRCVAEIKTDEVNKLVKSVGGINDAFTELQALEDSLSPNPTNDAASASLGFTLNGLRQRHPQPK